MPYMPNKCFPIFPSFIHLQSYNVKNKRLADEQNEEYHPISST